MSIQTLKKLFFFYFFSVSEINIVFLFYGCPLWNSLWHNDTIPVSFLCFWQQPSLRQDEPGFLLMTYRVVCDRLSPGSHVVRTDCEGNSRNRVYILMCFRCTLTSEFGSNLFDTAEERLMTYTRAHHQRAIGFLRAFWFVFPIKIDNQCLLRHPQCILKGYCLDL